MFFLNVMIALNIQLLFIHDIKPKKIFEVLYLLGTVGLALIIDLIPFGFQFYGKNEYGECNISKLSKYRVIFKILLIYVSMIPGMLYCVVSFGIVCYYFKSICENLKKKWPNEIALLYGERVNTHNFIRKLYFRLAMYPVSCFISFFPVTLSSILFDLTGSIPQVISVIGRLGRRLTGTMNLISLLIDPQFQLAIISIYKSVIRERINPINNKRNDGSNTDVSLDSFNKNHGSYELYDDNEALFTDYMKYV